MPASLTQFIVNMKTYTSPAFDLGYNQSNRWDVRQGGETDCSALVITALKRAGFDTRGATYTGNMRDALCHAGWTVLPVNTPKKAGDILLNDVHHVAVMIDSNTLAQASIDENGRVTGGQSGNQTGKETNQKPYYNYPWNCILRFMENDTPHKYYNLAVDGYWGTETSFSYTVQAIQTCLVKHGYNIKIDGFRGRETYKALQQHYGTPPDGVISTPSALVKKMQQVYGCSIQDGIISTPSNLIKAIQTNLNQKGDLI